MSGFPGLVPGVPLLLVLFCFVSFLSCLALFDTFPSFLYPLDFARAKKFQHCTATNGMHEEYVEWALLG